MQINNNTHAAYINNPNTRNPFPTKSPKDNKKKRCMPKYELCECFFFPRPYKKKKDNNKEQTPV
ncbi:hypothetical protein COCSADRAFT_35506 [Bipolaris sorokiniana ND90Pr]|uniref:Uncharacterized protein n=1 Tax=Cochliobolus sativus (strain ND90Pr / ATCC 201652) TaxID=665912 RepID=M2ST45_COCSN|nr:uncharacterized protein COCSADRAFT_35506 [Bipolaris sorokiniana ND90Pr]EMD65460.1 hypothetical protein COCSADRAFT_35506 [Bipolaris sorokiniana ND90Pr]